MRVFKNDQPDAKKTSEAALARIHLGQETTFRNMTIFPLLDGSDGSPDYLTLDEALAQGSVHITEVSAEGSVPELKFRNEGDQPVLLLDGEELIGAKQNRILNLTILAPAKRTIVIPVSCVEAGRWRYRSAGFIASSLVYFALGRAAKMAQVSDSLANARERRADQHAVWSAIAAKAANLKTESTTAAMWDIYGYHAARIDDYVAAFATIDRQVGAAFAINGSVIGFDLFDYPASCRKLLPKLVRSYALDAIEISEQTAMRASRRAVEELLSAVARAQVKSFPAVGEGVDVRFTGPDLAGAGLIARGRVVHLSAFHVKDAPQE
ncbi:MAG TPA: DUF6569 family protein [Candidatus Acidoferrales bacterium]|nr:DUF6569 family protein [Candidatus Acidoferrales bacterium]